MIYSIQTCYESMKKKFAEVLSRLQTTSHKISLTNVIIIFWTSVQQTNDN